MGVPFLNEVLVIFGLSIAVIFACHRLKVPTIVGFLLTGILAGPHGLGLVRAVHEVEVLADIGVVLLLFTIGIEFSFKNLLRIKEAVLMGGAAQVGLTVVAIASLSRVAGHGLGPSIFFGFLVSLSSTAIVLRLMQERGEVDSPHGRTAFGILIFQDIVVVPMMLVTPLLAGGRGESGASVSILLAEAAAMVVMVVVSAKWVVPWSLYQVARTKSRELFLLSVLTICMAVAWLTSTLGLSLALGAFLAGLIISESEYSHQTLGNILPFRDVFTSFFFVSVGMLLDVRYLLQQPALILLVAFGLLLLKAVIACLTTGLMGFPIRTIILTGLALSQVGEFSFILSRVGLKQGLLSEEMYPLFLAVSVLTMAATPLVMALAPYTAEAISHLPMPSRLKSGLDSGEGEAVVGLKDHLVIIGFGVNGRNLARAAKAVGIPYAVIEMNPETARVERGRGEPMIYGDAVQEPVLLHAHVGEARTVVVAINDPAATRRITEAVRSLAPTVHLIVRTRYLQEMRPLYDLGADEVIPEEFETSVEIFARVMKHYLIPRDEIERLILEVRSGGYEMFRNLALDPATICDLDRYLHGIEISTLRVEESSPAAGRSLAEMELRKRHGVTVVAIRRGGEMLVDPDADEKMMANDILVVLGMPERLAGALPLFRSQRPQRADQSSVIGR